MTTIEASDIERWSTTNEAKHRRIDVYADALSKTLTPMRVTNASSNSFDVGFSSVALGPITILQMHGVGHRVDRDKQEIEQSLEHSFHLLLNTTGFMNLSHRQQAQARTGDAIFVDSSHRYSLELPDYDVVHLRLPEAWMRQWLPAPGALAGRTIRRDTGWGAALTSFMLQLKPDILTTTVLPPILLADQIGSLLSLVANEMVGAISKPGRVERALGDKIRACIVEQCTAPDMTAARIAGVLAISTRTLHRTLAASRQTFGALLVAARRDVAVRMLESPLFKRLTSAEIGRRAGFVDASHFVRVVRNGTGRTPGQIRRAAGILMSPETD